MKDWNVWVCRGGRSVVIGTVSEQDEPLARCAALSRFAVTEDELDSGEAPFTASAILPEGDFWVSPV
ncbi:hypothetical protein BA022_08285 [Diaphorobacter nitroreducens]|uniref:hypothetical protein n=1 Tax=Diaphorobacter nitroreducens TaxID=164759 RepID=UPI000B59FBA4|nr:hypothetical protein [Diaphorobacter nitroreducens]ASI68555.1 hypothetical protein BA022_08285 [Diaphorobacter nitroreducens]